MADNKVNSGLLEFSEDQKVFVALDAETSEVKKAVTIDGDGVETDIAGGGGGDVTVEALSVTENGTYSEEGKAYSPVTVNVEAAASDFSIAQVTIIIPGDFEEYSPDACPTVDTENNWIQSGFYITTSPTTFTVPLYKGKCVWEGSFHNPILTGDIESLEYGLLITGDGTITLDLS